MPRPNKPPNPGAMMQTVSQPTPFAWNGTMPQPAKAENKRGAKSRAGLKQAIVSGPQQGNEHRDRQPNGRGSKDVRTRFIALVRGTKK